MSTNTPTQSTCGVSVIIPLYNAEKYIAECLDSILAQTFKDYEVIVVDDCSTDNSTKIVEEYAPKFEGRLKFAKTEANSGGSGEPRNKGLELASGEYIFFLDADDTLTQTALEEMFTLAKEQDADVVYCEKYFISTGIGQEFKDKIAPAAGKNLQKPPFVDNPTLESEDLAERFDKWMKSNYWMSPSLELIRRELLIGNEIKFPALFGSSDSNWLFKVLFCSKKFLRVPNACYVKRIYDEAEPSRNLPTNEYVHKHVDRTIRSLKDMDNFMGRFEFFNNNPKSRHEILDRFVTSDFIAISEKCSNASRIAMYNIFRQNFGEYLGDYDVLVSALCARLHNQYQQTSNNRKTAEEAKKRVVELEKEVKRQGKAQTRVAELEKELQKQKATQKRVTELEKTVAQQKKKINSLSNTSGIAVSIIIPVYNAELFIGEALDSILVQTFQNFEVIVVDDCSTDSSYNVVESYIPKFKGRLKLLSMGKNSGSAPAPRNKGFILSRGEYIFFMDSDDTLTKTGLEEMYTLAKEYAADVVYCEKYYMSTGVGQEYIKNVHLADSKIQKPPFVKKPTIISNDLGERIQELSERKFWFTPWQRLVSRELLAINKITFPEIIGCDDVIWCLLVLCCAKKFLRVPNACYVRRMYEESFTQSSKKSPNKHIHQWMDRPIRGLKIVDDFISGIPFFQENPYYRYKIYDLLSMPSFDVIAPVCTKLTPSEVYEIFLQEFTKDTGNTNVLVSYLCTRICEQNKILKKVPPQFKQLPEPEEPRRVVEPIGINRPPLEKAPAISVIVALYNYEKYIGECLDSLLAQTFQDFEVIVVDDCSTDKSVEVVESYVPKFNGRLILTQTEENSGGGGKPRNIGFSLAMGEYVFFMDADDVFTKTALEEMYTLGKEFNADVVYCEKYLMSEGSGEKFAKNIQLANTRIQKPPFVNEPTLETDDMAERTKMAVNVNYWMTPWLRLVQRQLLLDNNIKFDLLIASNDVSWTFKVLFCSKRFLRIPNACYIRRIHNESVTFRKRTPAEYVHKWMDIAVRSLKSMDNFMGKIEFFRKDLRSRHSVLNYLLQSALSNSFKECQNLTKSGVYNIFRQNFGEYLGEYDVLTACFFSRVFDQGKWWDNKYKKLESDSQARIAELEEKVRLMTEEINVAKSENDRLRDKQLDLEAVSSISQFVTPAISIIIPMYNAEEYIGECLESLLIQTFQNFEVIIVDDCSTDDSVKIVESYAPQFEGRLQITQTKENSGGGGYVPRNLGFKLARGEYVFFVDSDDFILGNALETLYKAAKDYDVDVVYTAAHFLLKKPDEAMMLRDAKGRALVKEGVEEQPTLIIDNPQQNLQELIFDRGFTTPWSKLIRRDFLIKNDIVFPEVTKAGDHIWTINVYCQAKRFLRLPVPLYFYRRYNATSISRTKRTVSEQFSYWIAAFIEWLTALNELSNKTEILRENPTYCYEASKRDFEWLFNCLTEERKSSTNADIYEILYREFSNKNGSFASAIPFFFSIIENEKKSREEKSQAIDKLKKEVAQLKKNG